MKQGDQNCHHAIGVGSGIRIVIGIVVGIGIGIDCPCHPIRPEAGELQQGNTWKDRNWPASFATGSSTARLLHPPTRLL